MTHIRLSIGPGVVGGTFQTLAILVVVVMLTSDDEEPTFARCSTELSGLGCLVLVGQSKNECFVKY